MSSRAEKDRYSDDIQHGFGPNGAKSNRVSFIRSKKDRNRLEKRKVKVFNSNSISFSSSFGCFGRRVSSRRAGGCLWCFKKGDTWGSNAESPTSDPNSPEFTHGMLRDLIEKNDFFSKECNFHGIEDK